MWRLSGDQAECEVPELHASINYSKPWSGWQPLQCFGQPVPGFLTLLQARVQELVSPDTPLSEVYIRGNDLVATFVPSAPQAVRLQIYFRMVAPSDALAAVGLELILSAQTDLLDSRPQIEVRSTFPAGELLHWEGSYSCFQPVSAAAGSTSTLFLFRPANSTLSYVEMIHPSDFAGVALPSFTSQLAWTLFPESLEKGVIRRSRVCGLFIPREQDTATALAAYRRLEAEPLPLTV